MAQVIRRFMLLATVIAVAACTPRAAITPQPVREVSRGVPVEILVGTTRARAPDGTFLERDRGGVSFAGFDVWIPEAHQSGMVEVGGADPDPAKHFVVRAYQPMKGAEFRRTVAQRLAANPAHRGEVLVFVHGFNNTMADGIFRTAQIVSDLGIEALPVLYSWPTAASALGYAYDRDSAAYARSGLERLIEELAAAGASDIILMAHSMGSHLAMETLRQMAIGGRGAAWDRLSGVALLAPDIDIDLFHAQVQDTGPLPQPFLIFVSQRDRALRLSARLTGQHDRLGNISSADRVAALDVTVINVTDFRDARNVHLTAVSSPTLIALASQSGAIEAAFRDNDTARVGLLPGTILTVQNATEVILDPTGARAAND